MTEQQAQSPIDDLFRNTLENLPDTPSPSGWDTPSDRVWQNVQASIQTPRKGWSTPSVVAAIAIVVALVAIGLYWTMSKPTPVVPTSAPVTAPVEQPVVTPTTPAEGTENQALETPKPANTGNSKPKELQSKPDAHNTTEETKLKPGMNGAQPLPGSKQTLPPNSTEAQKKQKDQN